MTSQGTWLTVNDAASLAGVGSGTIRNWMKGGLISHQMVDGAYRIGARAFRSAKVLRQKHLLTFADLLELKIDERDLARAIDAGAVVPSPGAARRFSLDDRDTLVLIKQGNWVAPEPAATPAEPPPSLETLEPAEAPSPHSEAIVDAEPDDFEQRLGRWPALRAYILVHKDPTKLPGHFWETRLCPEFVPPVGVFRYIHGQSLRFADVDHLFAGIKRSEGWLADGSRLRFVPEKDPIKFAPTDGWTPGAEPPQYRTQNMRWKNARLEWRQAWFRHRRQLLASGVDIANLPDPEPSGGRNRRALLRRYHEEHWSPSDLPDWFWDTEAPPPFEPPTWVECLEYGDPAPDPKGGGEVGTWIRWTGMWQHPMGDPSYLDPPNEHYDWVPGRFEAGSSPPQYEAENHEYRLARMEWDDAYRRVQRLFHGKE